MDGINFASGQSQATLSVDGAAVTIPVSFLISVNSGGHIFGARCAVVGGSGVLAWVGGFTGPGGTATSTMTVLKAD
jgi:hypothetical protein